MTNQRPFGHRPELARRFLQLRLTRFAAVLAADLRGWAMSVIRAERAFDGERMIDGGVQVVTEHDRIVRVEPSRPAPDASTAAGFPGSTILPGLIDMHVHLCGDGRPGALERLVDCDEDALAEVIDRALKRHLLAGVTTVRDLGDLHYAVVRRRDELRTGSAGVRPTIVASGPPITSRGGHCWYLGGEAVGRAELRAAVQERAAHGVDVVKIMVSGGAMTPTSDVLGCQFRSEEVRLVVEEAHAAGLPVTAHAHGLPAVERAVGAGVDGIEHCSCLTTTGIVMSDLLLETLAANRIVVCPTLGKIADMIPPPALAAIMAQAGMTWANRQHQVGRMHRGGARVVSGTDGGISPGKPHGILAEALADLVAGDVPAVAALASATSVAAEACGLGGRKGRLRAGCDADLVVVDGDPRHDIGVLRSVIAVMVGGVFVDVAARLG